MIKVYGSWCVYCKLGWLTEFHATLRSSSNFSFFILLLLLLLPNFTNELRKIYVSFFSFFLKFISPTNYLSRCQKTYRSNQRFPRYIYPCSVSGDKTVRQKRRVFRETSYFFLSLSPDLQRVEREFSRMSDVKTVTIGGHEGFGRHLLSNLLS